MNGNFICNEVKFTNFTLKCLILRKFDSSAKLPQVEFWSLANLRDQIPTPESNGSPGDVIDPFSPTGLFLLSWFVRRLVPSETGKL